MDYTPSVADVGSILRARTKDTSGNEAGTFTADTRPTGLQVEGLIGQATAIVAAGLPDDLPDALASTARWLIAVRAAMLVELTYFPEQVNTDSSIYAELKELFGEGTATLAAASHDNRPGQRRVFSLGVTTPMAQAVVPPVDVLPS